jgi:hypothetical protein
VRDVPHLATVVDSQMEDARKSSAGDIDLEVKSPDPSPIRRSNSYSNAVADGSTVNTTII